jgi:hypothetical protein
MPRKSAAAKMVQLVQTDTGPRLTPPSSLTKAQATTFSDLVRTNPHLTISDVPLLVAFTQAATTVHRLGAKQTLTGEWERGCRTMIAMARALRLLPINATHPEKLARVRRAAGNDLAEQYFQELEAFNGDDPGAEA